jgi:hypothetical protein
MTFAQAAPPANPQTPSSHTRTGNNTRKSPSKKSKSRRTYFERRFHLPSQTTEGEDASERPRRHPSCSVTENSRLCRENLGSAYLFQ